MENIILKRKFNRLVDNILISDNMYTQIDKFNKALRLSKKAIYKNPKQHKKMLYDLYDLKDAIQDGFIIQFEHRNKPILDDYRAVYEFDQNDFRSYDDFLDFVVLSIRMQYENEYNTRYRSIPGREGIKLENMCSDLSKTVYSRLQMFGIFSRIIRIYPGFTKTELLENQIVFHDFVLASYLNKEYIIDLSYSQFFILKDNLLNSLGLPYYQLPYPGVYMLQNDSRLATARTILEKGYIEATDENLKNYCDGFALCFRNGLFYQEKGSIDYTTEYSARDYMDFFDGSDSQYLREGKEYLGIQRNLLNNKILDFSSGTIQYEDNSRRLVKMCKV